MTKGEAIKQLLVKSVIPVAVVLLLVCIFKSACTKDGALNYLWL